MRIGIIGLGSIGSAIAKAFLTTSWSVSIVASVKSKERLELLESTPEYDDVVLTLDNQTVVKGQDQIYLCIKPLQGKDVCKEIKDSLSENTVVISVMAGVPLKRLQEWLGTKRVIKVMPTITVAQNGPVIVYDPDEIKPQMPFFPLFNVETEIALDKFTGESGCMPGFLSFIFEEWIEALVSSGIPRRLAEKVFIQNLVAYSQMVNGFLTQDHLVNIRKRVTSRAGATEQGLSILKKANLREIFKETVATANSKVEQIKDQF